ncbi:hypothetical protein J2T09_000103 [Neorhizobium huautlense]|uniref:Uncharacterized protein n=1 Tax=Neorhizobium huautlense TaxID=67774 RepID=A0ABT9PLL9_9HYPH|nr:hypothetical protein [Neorhizobium huautlense]MDP9835362.1 hypothetical protein [Neorhizobium huautlense]
MENADQAKIAQGGWPSLLFIVGCFFLYLCGIHLGQIAAIADPWPDNMAAMLSNAPFSTRVFRGAGFVIFILFTTLTLAGSPAFRSLASLMDATRKRFSRLDRRHAAIIIGVCIFGLPLLLGAEMLLPKFFSGVGLLMFGGALLINRGIAGCAVLGVAWVMAGTLVSDDVARRFRDIDETCRPGARIVLQNGENLACTSVQKLGLYDGLLIRSETGSTFVPTEELEPQSVIKAVGQIGRIMF